MSIWEHRGRLGLNPTRSLEKKTFPYCRGAPIPAGTWRWEAASPGFGDTSGARGVLARGREAMLASSIPSARLEQEAQMFGLRDKTLPPSVIGSPQQMQTPGFIRLKRLRPPCLKRTTTSCETFRHAQAPHPGPYACRVIMLVSPALIKKHLPPHSSSRAAQ